VFVDNNNKRCERSAKGHRKAAASKHHHEGTYEVAGRTVKMKLVIGGGKIERIWHWEIETHEPAGTVLYLRDEGSPITFLKARNGG
jgi:hypothetical protein